MSTVSNREKEEEKAKIPNFLLLLCLLSVLKFQGVTALQLHLLGDVLMRKPAGSQGCYLSALRFKSAAGSSLEH